MMQSLYPYIIEPEGEIYKCWDDVSDADKIVGFIKDEEIELNSRFIRYAGQVTPFNDECKICHAFPICEGGGRSSSLSKYV